ncbi:unnamed protein product [Rhizopus stolonifer]
MELNFFSDLQQSFEQDTTRRDEIRSAVKELDRTCRQLTAKLNQIHTNPKGEVPTMDYTLAREQFKL